MPRARRHVRGHRRIELPGLTAGGSFEHRGVQRGLLLRRDDCGTVGSIPKRSRRGALAAERERDEEAKRAVADERLRIAQELHDVVAHSMGVIAVQAGVGAHVIDNDPAEAKKSLEAISSTSRATLTEIRRILGVLRDDTGAEYQPSPGLEELPKLVHDVRAAGIDVDVKVEGARCELPPGLDLTAYRIVQEALTNVLKHAGPAPRVGRRRLRARRLAARGVRRRARRQRPRREGGGHGLMGMRERVAVYGGTLVAGPKAGGGFRVDRGAARTRSPR